MKTIDYINSLIKEKDELKALCKTHVRTIHTLRKEIQDLKKVISKKDLEIKQIESQDNITDQNELESVKNELNMLGLKYNELQNMYDDVLKNSTFKSLNKLKTEHKKLQRKYEDSMRENEEYKRLFEEIESICDSDV
jgi:chromosome segregation ATPase